MKTDPCHFCGAFSAETNQQSFNNFIKIRDWMCINGHQFKTAEVPLPFLNTWRNRMKSTDALKRRIALYSRDLDILSDYNDRKLSVAAIAEKFKLTEARVRQILKK